MTAQGHLHDALPPFASKYLSVRARTIGTWTFTFTLDA